MCTSRGPQLSVAETTFRQVYPNWLEDDGQPSSQAFHPWREVDEGCLSIDRGSLTTPSAAFELFTRSRPLGFGQNSAGVWGLSLDEIVRSGLTAWEDGVDASETTPANPAHGVVKFESIPPNKWKHVGRILKKLAIARGRLHPGV
jgi:hypothetical protein